MNYLIYNVFIPASIIAGILVIITISMLEGKSIYPNDENAVVNHAGKKAIKVITVMLIIGAIMLVALQFK